MDRLRHHVTPSPIGPLLLVADGEDQLVGVFTAQHRKAAAGPRGAADAGGVLAEAAGQLEAYFAGELRTFALRTRATGTALQKRVWAALAGVPYGTTTAYGALARTLGLTPGAARAVGAANGRNPLSIVVPCHRVVAATGALTGYAGGLDAKQALLALESRAVGTRTGPGDA